jgi:hypothetical protein
LNVMYIGAIKNKRANGFVYEMKYSMFQHTFHIHTTNFTSQLITYAREEKGSWGRETERDSKILISVTGADDADSADDADVAA